MRRRLDLFALVGMLLLPSVIVGTVIAGQWQVADEEAQLVRVLRRVIAADADRDAERATAAGDVDGLAPDFATHIAAAALQLRAAPLTASDRQRIDDVVRGEAAWWEVARDTLAVIRERDEPIGYLLAELDEVAALGRPLTMPELEGLVRVGEDLALLAHIARSRGDDDIADALCLNGYQLGTLLDDDGGFSHAWVAVTIHDALQRACAESLGIDNAVDRGLAIDAVRQWRDAESPLEPVAQRELALMLLTLQRAVGPLSPSTIATLPPSWSVFSTPLMDEDASWRAQHTARWVLRQTAPWATEMSTHLRGRGPAPLPLGRPAADTTNNFLVDLDQLRAMRATRDLDRRLLLGRLSLEIFYDVWGRWPTDLEELVLEGPVDAEELSDPATSEPFFLYRHGEWATLMAIDGGRSIRATPPD